MAIRCSAANATTAGSMALFADGERVVFNGFACASVIRARLPAADQPGNGLE